MFSFIKLLLIISLSAAMVFFLNDNSSLVTIEIWNKKIKTTLFLFLLSLVIISTLFYVICRSLYSIIILPFSIRANYRNMVNESKFSNLADFVISIDQYNYEKAKKALTLLLMADIPIHLKSWLNYKKSTLNQVEIKEAIEGMIQHPETAQLAIIKLIDEEIDKKQYLSAIKHLRDQPNLKSEKWIFPKTIIAYAKTGNWKELLNFLNDEKSAKFNKSDLINICNYKIAEGLYYSHSSIDSLKEAISFIEKIKPSLIPAIHLKSLILIKQNEQKDAAKFISKNWSSSSKFLLLPAIILLESLGLQRVNEIIEDIASTSENSEASIILRLYGLLVKGDAKSIKKLIERCRDKIAGKYLNLFEQYYSSVIEEKNKVLSSLFEENLCNLIRIDKICYYYNLDSEEITDSDNKGSTFVFADISYLRID